MIGATSFISAVLGGAKEGTHCDVSTGTFWMSEPLNQRKSYYSNFSPIIATCDRTLVVPDVQGRKRAPEP